MTGDVGQATITEQIALRAADPVRRDQGRGGDAARRVRRLLRADRRGSLRFSNVYGPGMEAKDSFVPRLMRAARDGTGVQIYGDGTQLRDLVHVDDIVAGIFAAWRPGHSGPLILGSGESVTVNDIVDAARR